MRLHRYRRAALVACSIGLLAAAWPAAAQNFPTRPVRLIIGFPPGGATDLVARIMAPKYTELLGQQVVVDNRTGANGTIGSHLAAQATPDGHTIHLATIGSLVISPAIGKVPYDPIKDFQPISQAVALQNIFIVHPSVPVKTMKELVALANKSPKGLDYASSGVGSPGNLAGELLKSMTKANLVHVPYKGGGPAMTALLANQVGVFIAVISTAVPQVKAGRVRAIAVTGNKRSVALPDTPTVGETYKGYEALNWYGYVVPAGTPPAIVERLHKATVTVLEDATVRKMLLDRGIETAPTTPAAFGAYIQSETKKWRPIIEAAGMKDK